MRASIFVAKDFHGIKLFGDSGLDQVHRELGLVQGSDNIEILVDFFVAAINNIGAEKGLF